MANIILDKEMLNQMTTSAVNGILQGMENFNYLDLVWRTRAGESIALKNMPRSHVRNTLQWCLRKGASPDDEKDGIRYADWIAYFTTRLLDPELGD